MVDDDYIAAFTPDDSGKVKYRNTSPVTGFVWHATDNVNRYANLGRGFETPTLTESAYQIDATGPNLSLLPSTSVQAEPGAKIKHSNHAIDVAVFDTRSRNEIVPSSVINGSSIFQNIDDVQRRGVEASWQSYWPGS